MQASTVLMLMIGLGLLVPEGVELRVPLERWIRWYASLELDYLKGFILREAETYLEGHRTIYQADEFAITVMTDTTERAPTFNLAPFDNQHISQGEPSLTYLTILGTFKRRIVLASAASAPRASAQLVRAQYEGDAAISVGL